jgi:hypothetical protein
MEVNPVELAKMLPRLCKSRGWSLAQYLVFCAYELGPTSLLKGFSGGLVGARDHNRVGLGCTGAQLGDQVSAVALGAGFGRSILPAHQDALPV